MHRLISCCPYNFFFMAFASASVLPSPRATTAYFFWGVHRYRSQLKSAVIISHQTKTDPCFHQIEVWQLGVQAVVQQWFTSITFCLYQTEKSELKKSARPEKYQSLHKHRHVSITRADQTSAQVEAANRNDKSVICLAAKLAGESGRWVKSSNQAK